MDASEHLISLAPKTEEEKAKLAEQLTLLNEPVTRSFLAWSNAKNKSLTTPTSAG